MERTLSNLAVITLLIAGAYLLIGLVLKHQAGMLAQKLAAENLKHERDIAACIHMDCARGFPKHLYKEKR